MYRLPPSLPPSVCLKLDVTLFPQVRKADVKTRTFVACIDRDELFVEEFSAREEGLEWRHLQSERDVSQQDVGVATREVTRKGDEVRGDETMGGGGRVDA